VSWEAVVGVLGLIVAPLLLWQLIVGVVAAVCFFGRDR